jgi:hypothetical protein
LAVWNADGKCAIRALSVTGEIQGCVWAVRVRWAGMGVGMRVGMRVGRGGWAV